ncbi:hypothetical protein BX661DRAFT_181039 [Kickxella alabastrina]|uniref:uncharacterized protein n=1 Tax=Kickxella alabastrina TaxID=61397 RepID=UPI00222104DA|nr:uncharacterized protein BX661DRAFT_181039 [Kickxella alabastrina]KAI7830072.1 hypothetical protein BX661DRAFT_181039 [Kickxella alabastrina]
MYLVAFVVHFASCALCWRKLVLLRADRHLGKSMLWLSIFGCHYYASLIYACIIQSIPYQSACRWKPVSRFSSSTSTSISWAAQQMIVSVQ